MAASRRKRSTVRRATARGALGAIEHFVVLMLENRSFDHLVGYTKQKDPRVAGMDPSDFNFEDPVAQQNKVHVCRASNTAMSFDPVHEFDDVQVQLYGPARGGGSNPPSNPAAMSGFIRSSQRAGGAKARQVMECFEPDQLPVLTKLAQEFALFNFWYSPMPGPTWPNRFFVHAGTSGGLNISPGYGAIAYGYSFKNGTIFDKLQDAGRSWRVYHDDFPQVLGIRSMRTKYTKDRYFRKMPAFYRDVKAGDLPEYTFIEPLYDAFNDFIDGNSMHPHNDVAQGEELIGKVYEAIRGSKLWPNTMLVVTFDEHGGFYDHVPPPQASPTGDDSKYSSAEKRFRFDLYGVRVPTVIASAYTDKGTVIGGQASDPSSIFDHCSIPATVRKRFGLTPLSRREANANTLDVVLNRVTPRDADAPKKLPMPRSLKKPSGKRLRGPRRLASGAKPLTKDQEAFLGLAIAMDEELNPRKRMSLAAKATAARSRSMAAAYAARVQTQALERREASGAGRRKATRPSKRKK